jgi:hypothetical protein
MKFSWRGEGKGGGLVEGRATVHGDMLLNEFSVLVRHFHCVTGSRY